MLMKSLIAAGFLASSALGAQLKLNVEDANQGCSAQQTSEDQANRLKMEVKLQSLGVVCEEMCQRVHAYPKCQCPGFGSMPAEDAAGDERTCFTKNCQDPESPCPNAAFETCVAETSKASLLQSWEQMQTRLQQTTDAMSSMTKKH